MRVSVRDGRTLWLNQMPAYEKPDKFKNPISYSGPVLVGGRLLLTDNLGNLLAFDAASGAAQPGARVDGGSLTGPVVANGTVYVLADNGTLYAFR